ncbi:DUF3558 domain-containing protein [Streptomyces sp. NPDC047002]|uniref:DUF3558 domain-containing protein n=1 Tax=Streptomyces sp. NPDC047002 TaxID=3155475 RepID=UPI003454A995
MRRSASRLPRILAAAAVPALLVVAGCSSGSDGGSGSDGADGAAGGSSSPSAAHTPTVAPAKYRSLPDACKAIDAGTVKSLVPNAKPKGGTAGTSTDVNAHSSCAWNGLKDKGVDGSQYRWLEVSLSRFDSQTALGSGNAQASKQYATEIDAAQTTQDAKSVMTSPVTGAGDQATQVSYELHKSGEDFRYATVVARADNVVVSLTFNGAGFEGQKTPSKDDIAKGAVKAAKSALGAIEDGGTPAASGSGSSGADSGAGSGSSKGSGSGKGSGTSSARPSTSASPSGSTGHDPGKPGSAASPSASKAAAGADPADSPSGGSVAG